MQRRLLPLAFCALALTPGCHARATSGTETVARPLKIAMRPGDTLNVFQRLPQFSVEVAPIGDSQQRLRALNDGAVDITSAVADVTYTAFYRGDTDAPVGLRNIRGIALLNRAVVHLLVAPGVDVDRGLRGLRIVLGDPAGASRSLGAHLLKAMGVPASEISGEFVPYEAAVAKLLDGDADAMIASMAPPQDTIVRALRGGAHLMEIKGPAVDRLRAEYPLLKRMLLPAGTYPGQGAPLHTVGVDLLLLCRADLDADVAYDLARAFFKHMPENLRRRVDSSRAPATVIPLHPGAARYYREEEMRR